MNNQAFAALDAGLQALGELSPEYGAELSDHAPMVLEALDRLEASAAIAPFLARTLPKLRKLNAVAEPGLGNYEQLVAQASEELLQKGGPQVLLDWFPRYAPGLAGAAFHGLIRLAHAQRSLARASSASAESLTLRRAELAKALAYACVRAQVLAQAEAPAEAPRLGVQQALRELEPSPEALATRSGLISTALARRAGQHPHLAQTAAALQQPQSPLEALRELRRAAVDLLLDGEYLELNTFTMLHAVTGMDAALTLGQALPEEQARQLAKYAAHALLAMRVAFVGRYPLGESQRQNSESFATLLQRALTSLDDHAIKLAAALNDAREDLGEDRCAEALARWVQRR